VRQADADERIEGMFRDPASNENAEAFVRLATSVGASSHDELEAYEAAVVFRAGG
jgi:hypothetical protein